MNTQPWIESTVVENFLRYVRIHTTSDPHSPTCPSTPFQWDLARLLKKELEDLGVPEVEMTEFGYVVGKIPPSPGYHHCTPIGFLAHMDTSPDFSGEGVKPKIWKNYDGSALELGDGVFLDPNENDDNKHMLGYKGQTLITSDGSTLLGADDKAGVAEIMTAVAFWMAHPEAVHGPIEIIFTPDEEIGRGVDKLNLETLKSKAAYTLDGSTEGTYNEHCFNAYTVGVTFTGRMIHPGYARGVMVNAVAMAGAFIAGLPRSEAPETTDGRYGFYAPQEIEGRMDHAFFRLFIRDFSIDEIHRRLTFLDQLARTIEGSFPGGKVELEATKQYLNLHDFLASHPKIMGALVKGIEETGAPAVGEVIRGGTDGARLSERGLPTPNIFTGGHNFHSRYEWIALPAMVRATQTVINIARIWTEDERK
ncbi:MAG: peptidase T [Spirochaetales bacterium]|nr:peptidase T [Spirochaetales bacterium]